MPNQRVTVAFQARGPRGQLPPHQPLDASCFWGWPLGSPGLTWGSLACVRAWEWVPKSIHPGHAVVLPPPCAHTAPPGRAARAQLMGDKPGLGISSNASEGRGPLEKPAGPLRLPFLCSPHRPARGPACATWRASDPPLPLPTQGGSLASACMTRREAGSPATRLRRS